MHSSFLQNSEFINFEHELIFNKAKQLAQNKNSPEETTKACFEYVRDEIKHSNDYKLNPITCKASDVLLHKTGYCYAKSHLLAALLRANSIPAGLCYQRLSIDDEKAPFCLHGLNAVYLNNHGWYKMDARGNKDGIDAQFNPPKEQLAFPINIEGEFDLPDIYAKPLNSVINVLIQHSTYQAVLKNLPDIETN